MIVYNTKGKLHKPFHRINFKNKKPSKSSSESRRSSQSFTMVGGKTSECDLQNIYFEGFTIQSMSLLALLFLCEKIAFKAHFKWVSILKSHLKTKDRNGLENTCKGPVWMYGRSS